MLKNSVYAIKCGKIKRSKVKSVCPDSLYYGQMDGF